MKRVIVFGSTMASAERYLTQVVQLAGVVPEEVYQTRKSESEIAISMVNGDFYQALVPTQSSKGLRATYIFVDLKINSDVIHHVLMPMVGYDGAAFFFR